MKPALILSLLLLFIPLLACGESPAETPAAPASADPEPAAPTPSPGLEPLSSRDRAPEPGGDAIEAPGLVFALPAGWNREPPGSSMRLAQAEIPGPGGPGQLTVFFFGSGGGGGVESNLERWIGQVDAESAPLRETFDSAGLRVHWVEVEGTLKPSTMGVGPDSPQPGSRLLAAVVEGPGGPWYFKATGPAATLAAERESFLDMLRSARPRG